MKVVFTPLSGTVNYNLTSWLEKNKDPLNDSVIDLMKNCGNSTLPIVFKVALSSLFSFCPIFQPRTWLDTLWTKTRPQGRRRREEVTLLNSWPCVAILCPGKTVSSFYKEQLFQLMTTLHSTEPHFIRLIERRRKDGRQLHSSQL